MLPQDLNASFSTQASEGGGYDLPEHFRQVMVYLHSVFIEGSSPYEIFLERRDDYFKGWAPGDDVMNGYGKEGFLIELKYIHALFDKHTYVNTPAYAQYVHDYQQASFYVNYAVELPKIKHRILEAEVNWYVENMPKQVEIKEEFLSFFKPVLEQDPRLARHTRAVINHALEQLEEMAAKITVANAKEYAQDKERYTWCLTGMVPLLSEEEKDPFKEGGLHQRWQKARHTLQEAEM